MGIYGTTIPNNATGRVCVECKLLHTAQIKDHATFDTTVRLVRQFLIDHVEDIWIRTHWDPIFQYSRVPCRTLLATIQNIATGRQATDRISLLNEMQTYFAKASGLPQYINMLQDLQKTPSTSIPMTPSPTQQSWGWR